MAQRSGDGLSDPGDGAEAELARLRWRCRRGMRELDAVLQNFLVERGASLSAADRLAFGDLLDLPDPDLHAYLTGRTVCQSQVLAALVARIVAATSSPR
jgi:antitoxin CptB